MASTSTSDEFDRLVRGEAHDPHAVLGAHPVGNRTEIRTLRPGAERVVVLDQDERFEAERVHEAGIFVATVPGTPRDYRLEVTGPDGTAVVDDPYRWLPTLGDTDLHLIGEGRHEELWRVLGAHPRSYETPNGTVAGVSFAVWAPNARAVRVFGDSIGWGPYDGLPMRSLGSSGVWELFVPGFPVDGLYKYRILGADGNWREKADPMARATEVPPRTASRVYESHYQWRDDDWLAGRAATAWHERPVSIYEVHLGSWRPGLSYTELADELVQYVTGLGFTHVELMPIAEHPFGGSWGYQVTSYYAPTARFGSPDQFRHLVDRLHAAGIGVLLDWVPAHFPRDEWALARFDGTPCYEHPDWRRGEHPEWGTYVFDYGRREVRNFLVANALYWCEEFHIDGLRVDAVASMLYLDYSRKEGEWTPNVHGGRENLDAVSLLQEVNATVYRKHPGVLMVAEESTAWPGVTRPTYLGGLGFGFKWNMGWMHDTLTYAEKDPVYRQFHHHQMTFSLMYAWSENFILPISHDEVVHGKGSLYGKMPGDQWKKLAGVRALLGFMWAHPGKQLLFAGSEFAQPGEWSEEKGLEWDAAAEPGHAGVSAMVGDLNRAYRDSPALWTRDVSPEGFAWIDANDAAGNVFSFLRWGSDGSVLACVSNFAGGPHPDYRLGLPRTGRWEEILNTDATTYGGSGWGNFGGVDATTETPWHGQPASASVQVPPLATVWFRHVPD
ncbi:MAG: 1,4-alpha-glucan branching protein GlgB [Actinocatenispora sp.]